MKNIAVLTTGDGRVGREVARILEGGSRFRVVLSAGEDEWRGDTAVFLASLRENDVDLLLVEGPIDIPAAIEGEYAGHILKTEAECEDALAEAEKCVRQLAAMETPPPVPTPREVDRMWAEVLGVECNDIPPVPEVHADENGVEEEIPEIPEIPGKREIPEIPGNPVMYGKNVSGEPAPQQGERRPMPPTYLLWAVLATVLCCFIPGIVALVYSSQVSSRYYAGDEAGAWRSSRNAEIWIIVSFVLGLVSGAIYLPLMML